MREVYVKKYAEGMMLRASLNLIESHVSFPPAKEEALTLTEWGQPFYLTYENAPYVFMFIRAADRALYHATNAWRKLIADISVIPHLMFKLEEGHKLHTYDQDSKYEIEAFLAAVMTITDNNLIGIEKNGFNNRLGNSRALGEFLITELRAAADDFQKLGFDSKWRHVRNSAYHLKREIIDGEVKQVMTDRGSTAQIRKEGKRHIVSIEGVHYVEGAPTDFVELFTDSFDAFIKYITDVRNLLTQFSFQHISIPQHGRYSGIIDPLGNMNVCFDKNGYELRYFPETASDFVGPLKAG